MYRQDTRWCNQKPRMCVLFDRCCTSGIHPSPFHMIHDMFVPNYTSQMDMEIESFYISLFLEYKYFPFIPYKHNRVILITVTYHYNCNDSILIYWLWLTSSLDIKLITTIKFSNIVTFRYNNSNFQIGSSFTISYCQKYIEYNSVMNIHMVCCQLNLLIFIFAFLFIEVIVKHSQLFQETQQA